MCGLLAGMPLRDNNRPRTVATFCFSFALLRFESLEFGLGGFLVFSGSIWIHAILRMAEDLPCSLTQGCALGSETTIEVVEKSPVVGVTPPLSTPSTKWPLCFEAHGSRLPATHFGETMARCCILSVRSFVVVAGWKVAHDQNVNIQSVAARKVPEVA